MSRARFLTSSLATVAVASALTFTGSAAHAAPEPPRPGTPAAAAAQQGGDKSCGQPGTPAVWQDVVVGQESVEVTNETLVDTWIWSRTVSTIERKYQKELSPEVVEVVWERTVPGPAVLEWQRQVMTKEAVPASPGKAPVTKTERVEVTPEVKVAIHRWELVKDGEVKNSQEKPADWGGGNGADQAGHWVMGEWLRDEIVQEAVFEDQLVVIEPAVPPTPGSPAEFRTETEWSVTRPYGDGWESTGRQVPGEPEVETRTTSGATPEGDGWSETDRRVTPAQYTYLWSAEAPDDYAWEPTDDTQSVDSREHSDRRASAPDGEGWVADADSHEQVLVEETHVETRDVIERQIVTPATQGTPPREQVAGPKSGDSDGETDEETSVGGPTAPGGTSAVAGPVEDAAQPSQPSQPSQAAPAAGATVAPTSGPSGAVLPATGNDASIQTALTGLGAVLAGAWLMLRNRRRTGA